jgi:hypothetical protein
MGRAYAGILGPLACGIILARGILAGGSAEGTLLAASGGLFLFAAIGYLAGQAAELLVRDSVKTQFQAALIAWETQNAENKAAQPADRMTAQPADKMTAQQKTQTKPNA